MSDHSGMGQTTVLTDATAPMKPAERFRGLLEVGHVEVCEYAIKFERLRRRVPIAWITPVAGILAGAGLGAYVQEGKWQTLSAVSCAVGFTLLVALSFARQERAENLHNLCDDFLRFVDRWQAMEGYDKNSEYVREVVNADQRATLGGIVRRVKLLGRSQA
jgi:hypothetical protein